MRLVVCHYTVGRDSTTVGDRGFFHFLVRRDGEVVQFAEADAVCWHAGPANQWGPGIEVEYLDEPEGIFTAEAYAATARLVEWLIGLGIPDAFYDGPRIDTSGFSGFITHRSIAQSDAHSDYWPELPRLTVMEDEMKPTSFLFGSPEGAVYVYDLDAHTATHIRTPAALSAQQALRALLGLSTDIIRNAQTDALIADARKIGIPESGPVRLDGVTFTGTFTAKAG
jgi:hypothetical protein